MIRLAALTLLTIAPFIAICQPTPTLDDFLGYSDSYVYSNLYHAVNERCMALMWRRDTNGVEYYEIDPIPDLYEVAYKDTLRSSVTNITLGTNVVTITDKYLGYQVDYPATPPSDHVWANISSAQYPPDEPVLMRKATAYSRWMFTVSAPTGLAAAVHFDLGMEIHQKAALLVHYEYYRITPEMLGVSNGSPAIVMNTPGDPPDWEWNASRVEWLYDWNYTNFDDRPGYTPAWSNTPPPDFEWPWELSEEFPDPISLGFVDPLWMVRGSNYPSVYPPINHAWLTLSNGIGISATNLYSYTNSPPVTNIAPGWMSGCLTCHYVTSVVVAVTETNITLSMTNFAYHFPHPFNATTGGVEYLANRAPVASLGFKFGNFNETRETNNLVLGGVTNVEIITTRTRDILLDIVNHDDINDLPQPWTYTFDELFEDTELPDPKIDESLNVHVFYRKSTNEYYDSLFDYDLPDFYYISRVVTNRVAPGYGIQTNGFGPGMINVAPNNFNEPFADSYHFTLYAGNNSTADFVLSNGIHRFATTEVTYSIRTNLNEYFPAFPVNDQFIFLGRPLEYRLTPDYDGSKAHISRQWMWQKWLQLDQMRITRARLTEYSSTWTNFHTKIVSDETYYYRPSTNQIIVTTNTTNYFSSLLPFDEGPLIYTNRADIETYTDHDGLIGGLEETSTFEGRIKFLKSTNLSASLSVLTADRYHDNRWRNPGIGIYGGINFAAEQVFSGGEATCSGRWFTVSWNLVHPDGIDVRVDEEAAEQARYDVGAGVGEVEASWFFGANTNIAGATIDDRTVFPAVTLVCGDTTNNFPEVRFGGKRTGHYGAVKNLVEPVWIWDFQWPVEPE